MAAASTTCTTEQRGAPRYPCARARARGRPPCPLAAQPAPPLPDLPAPPSPSWRVTGITRANAAPLGPSPPIDIQTAKGVNLSIASPANDFSYGVPVLSFDAAANVTVQCNLFWDYDPGTDKGLHVRLNCAVQQGGGGSDPHLVGKSREEGRG